MAILRTILIILIGLFSFNALAQETATVIEKKVIVTPSPKATCSTVAAHWEGNTWVYEHDICKYENRTEGAAWVSDYWSCTESSADGACTAWSLVPGHWVKTVE